MPKSIYIDENGNEQILSSSPSALTGLQDTDIQSATSGQVLAYDGSKWVNGTVSTVGSIDDLNDVDTTGKAEGDSLVYNQTDGEWQAKKTIVQLTQAEYDALKLSGDLVEGTEYLISDAPALTPTASDIEYTAGVTVADSLDTINNYWPDNYSTNEKVIGKWIDDKPVYQKVVSVNANVTNSWIQITNITGVTYIISAIFVVYEGSGNRTYGVREGMFAEVNSSNEVVIFNNTGYAINVQYVILKYLKT